MKRYAGIVEFFAMVMGLAVLGCTTPTTTPPLAKTFAIGDTGPAGGGWCSMTRAAIRVDGGTWKLRPSIS